MGKQERMENAKDMRGSNTELWAMRKAVLVPDRWDSMSTPDRGTYMGAHGLGEGADVDVLVPAASQSQGIRKPEHAVEWMEESDFVGSVVAMRRHPWGKERNGVITRSPQTVFVIS
jgi:hypothetical protein